MRVASSPAASARPVASTTAASVFAATFGRLRTVFHAHTSMNSVARVIATGPLRPLRRASRAVVVRAGEPAGERLDLLGGELEREGPARRRRQFRPFPNSCRKNRKTLKMSRKMPAAIGTAAELFARRRRLKSMIVKPPKITRPRTA